MFIKIQNCCAVPRIWK